MTFYLYVLIIIQKNDEGYKLNERLFTKIEVKWSVYLVHSMRDVGTIFSIENYLFADMYLVVRRCNREHSSAYKRYMKCSNSVLRQQSPHTSTKGSYIICRKINALSFSYIIYGFSPGRMPLTKFLNSNLSLLRSY